MSDPVQDEGVPPYSWKRRRKFMYLVSAFCASVISFVLWQDMDSAAAETAVAFAFLCLGGIVGSYVFGATWQDVNRMKSGGR